MRGENELQSGMFSYFSPEQRVPAQHPLRAIKAHADAAFLELSRVFDSMYTKMGRSSIPLERLLKSQLLIAFYSVRSETQFCEMVDYNIRVVGILLLAVFFLAYCGKVRREINHSSNGAFMEYAFCQCPCFMTTARLVL